MSQNNISFLHSLIRGNEEPKSKIFKSIKARADSKRTQAEKIADWATLHFGNMTFLSINIILFIIWVFINTNQIKWIPAFDPFPFILLTTIVSLEAIILAIFVLISQNRSMRVDELREELNLQIDLVSEKEITKVLKMMILLLEKQGVDLSEDTELRKLLKPISEEGIEKRLEKEFL